MALPSTGPISMSQVNTELGRSATANISLNETEVRNLAAVPSGTISMNDLRGKSAFTLAIQGSTGPVYYDQTLSSLDAAVKLVISSNGSISLFEAAGSDFNTSTPDSSINDPVVGAVNLPTAWGTPLTGGIGSNFEVQYSGLIDVGSSGDVLRVFGASYFDTSGTITTPWVALSSDQTITGLATGASASDGRAVLGDYFNSPGVNNGTISIRRIGTTSPVASFSISAIIAEKQGD